MRKIRKLIKRIDPTIASMVMLALFISLMMYAGSLNLHAKAFLVWLLVALAYLNFSHHNAENEDYIEGCHDAIRERDAVIAHQQKVLKEVQSEYQGFQRSLNQTLRDSDVPKSNHY